jgi:hypothetical protein
MDRYTAGPPGDSLRRLERRLRWYRGIALLGLASLLAAACAAFMPGVFPLGSSSRPPSASPKDTGTCDCKLHPSTKKQATGMSRGIAPHSNVLREFDDSEQAGAPRAGHGPGASSHSAPDRAGATEPDPPSNRDAKGDPEGSVR